MTYLFLTTVFILCLSPVLSLIYYALSIPAQDLVHWSFLRDEFAFKLTANTLLLCLGTMTLSALVGTACAIFMEYIPKRFELLFEVLLTLPMTLPIYIFSFAYVGAFEWSSPLPTLWRSILGQQASLPSIKNLVGAVFVFSMALYPYVFIPLRLALKNRWYALYKGAQLLGKSRFVIWKDVVASLGKKPIVVGSVIVGMECLSEFGAVSMLSVDTFTTAIYTAWSSFYSLEMAARLGLMLLLFSVPLMSFEAWFTGHTVEGHFIVEEGASVRSYLAMIPCLFVVIFSLGVPSGQLIFWLIGHEFSYDFHRVLALLIKTTVLALICAFIITIVSALCVSVMRFNSSKHFSFFRKFFSFTLYGYGVPGNLIAIAVLGLGQLVFGFYHPILATVLLIFALCFKFFRTSYKKAQVGNDTVSYDMERAGQVYSENKKRKFFNKVYLPLLRPYLLYGFLFVAIEVIKELPLTLVMRPMGLNTLSTKIFELTSEGEWEAATMYAVPLIVLCMFFHILVHRKSLGRLS